MVFGRGAQVDVGGLIATTASLSNDAFMSRDVLSFSGTGNPHAAIVNHGAITARNAGLVALVAPQVTNDGIIVAHRGKVALAGAEGFTYDLYGDGLVSLDSQKEVSVAHTGTISAQGGQVLLTAAQAEALVDSAINSMGIADASSAVMRRRQIVLTGERAKLLLAAGAYSMPRGKDGGGDIRIGGDYLGQGDMPNAHQPHWRTGALYHCRRDG